MADGCVGSLSASMSSQAEFPGKARSFHSAPIQPARYGLRCGINEQLHVVMVPYPVQGQINPMMEFAKLLTTRHDIDVTVTFVNDKHNYDRIQRTRSTAADQTDCNLHVTWVDSTGLLAPNVDHNDVAGSDLETLRESTPLMKEPLKQLLQSLSKCESQPPVSCVLFGSFCHWAQSAAVELGIPNFLFWTQSASVFSIYCHLPLLVTNNFFPYDRSKRQLPGSCDRDDLYTDTTLSDIVTCIPGLPPLRPSSFPSLLHVDDISDPSLASTRDHLSLVKSCNGVLINSFQELEKDTLQALQQELPYPVSFVGPLLPSAFMNGGDSADKTTGASLLQVKGDCIEWLDGMQKQSVLYISFGSLFKPSTAELEEIAAGIKASSQPYLWVIRPCASFQDVSEILPRGFVEETKDFGLIIPWAPQMQVLSHPAVGAFLTHCGWNSTLESLCMGMPMISYPILLDQPTNSACVCEVWKVGMALKRQDDGKVKSEDVEKMVKTVLREDEGAQMRERAMKLRQAARRAVQAQGSSYAYINTFIQGLTRNSREGISIVA